MQPMRFSVLRFWLKDHRAGQATKFPPTNQEFINGSHKVSGYLRDGCPCFAR